MSVYFGAPQASAWMSGRPDSLSSANVDPGAWGWCPARATLRVSGANAAICTGCYTPGGGIYYKHTALDVDGDYDLPLAVPVDQFGDGGFGALTNKLCDYSVDPYDPGKTLGTTERHSAAGCSSLVTTYTWDRMGFSFGLMSTGHWQTHPGGGPSASAPEITLKDSAAVAPINPIAVQAVIPSLTDRILGSAYSANGNVCSAGSITGTDAPGFGGSTTATVVSINRERVVVDVQVHPATAPVRGLGDRIKRRLDSWGVYQRPGCPCPYIQRLLNWLVPARPAIGV